MTSQYGAKERLRDYHDKIQYYITHDMIPGRKFSERDAESLPELISWANNHYSGLTLHQATTPNELGEVFKGLAQHQSSSARLIYSPTGKDHHSVALDYRFYNGQHSVIGMEPAIFENNANPAPGNVLRQVATAVAQNLPGAHFAMLEANQQRSQYDCAIFSLDFAIKMFKNMAVFDNIHQKNVQGILKGKQSNGVVPSRYADRLLPVVFSKHIQSSTHFGRLLDKNSKMGGGIVNKNNGGESLEVRVARHLKPHPKDKDKEQNCSIIFQREKYVRKALGL